MRIGLYGMPTAGKTHILDRIDFMEILVGSKLLREYDPDFDKQPESVREKDRKEVAKIMLSKEEFIMDGHYAFGDSIAFTEEEGNMYDIYLYLYIDPAVLKQRITNSPKNQKYSKFDVEEWQNLEIEGLRQYCHKHNKDFYVIDNPPNNTFSDVAQIIDFIRDIKNGYSCVGFPKKCADRIIKTQILYFFWTATKQLLAKIPAVQFSVIKLICMTETSIQVIRRGDKRKSLKTIPVLT